MKKGANLKKYEPPLKQEAVRKLVDTYKTFLLH